MTDQQQLLARCGEALYGRQWQTEMARDLEIADRTVRRWKTGQFQVPDGIWHDISRRLTERVRAIRDLQRRLG